MVCEASIPALEIACVCMCVPPNGSAIDPLRACCPPLHGAVACRYCQYYRIPGSAHLVLNIPANLQPFCG